MMPEKVQFSCSLSHAAAGGAYMYQDALHESMGAAAAPDMLHCILVWINESEYPSQPKTLGHILLSYIICTHAVFHCMKCNIVLWQSLVNRSLTVQNRGFRRTTDFAATAKRLKNTRAMVPHTVALIRRDLVEKLWKLPQKPDYLNSDYIEFRLHGSTTSFMQA